MPDTRQVVIEPNAVVVGLPPAHLVLCHEVLAAARLRVHAFEDPVAAAQRIARVVPRLVVVPATVPQDSLEMLDDAAVAVGAPLLLLYGDETYGALEARLQEAVREVEARFARPSARPTTS